MAATVRRLAPVDRRCKWCDLAYGRASKRPDYTFRYYHENGVVVLGPEVDGSHEMIFVPRRHAASAPASRTEMTGRVLLVNIAGAEALNDSRLRPDFDFVGRVDGGHWHLVCRLDVYQLQDDGEEEEGDSNASLGTTKSDVLGAKK